MIARRTFLAALAGLASSPALSDDKSSADIVVFAGQSNIQVNANTTLQNVPHHIVRDDGVHIWDCENKCFAVYEAGINSLQPVQGQIGGAAGNWGPEAEFSFLTRKAFPAKELHLVKFGIGSSQLASNPLIPNWCPSGRRAFRSGRKSHSGFEAGFGKTGEGPRRPRHRLDARRVGCL